MEQRKKRMAVLVGCNYPNTRYELHGCINDVVTMRDTLVTRFGFEPSNIELLTDKTGTLVMPTGVNIKRALDRMVDQAAAGDLLFFHYSGHGTRIPSVKPYNPFSQDEAIVPCDFNLITDVDFRQLVDRVPKGASFTIISDSCHSGGLIDKEKEQIGPSTINFTRTTLHSQKPRMIPFEAIHQHLSSLTNINNSDIGTHLLQKFGGDASLRFRLPPAAQDWFESVRTDAGILLSGCQANETSADMNPTMSGGKAYGAFSNAVQTVLRKKTDELSNRQVAMLARKALEAQHILQHPCLYCSDENVDAAFLGQPQIPSSQL